MTGYQFLSVKSAEGRRAPGNVGISEADYEASKQRILKAIEDTTMTHILHRERTPESIIGTCSCGNWSTESAGNDESSRAWVGWGFERHEGSAS